MADFKIISSRTKKARRNVGPLLKKTHLGLQRLYKEAVRDFIRELVHNDLVHVDTGMSMASLLPLARAVRMFTEVRANINPKRRTRKGYAGNPNGVRSISAGAEIGKKAYKLTFGSPVRLQLVFEFDIQVYQWLKHEDGEVPPHRAWKALDRGKQAFEESINRNFGRFIPKIGPYLFEGKIQIDG